MPATGAQYPSSTATWDYGYGEPWVNRDNARVEDNTNYATFDCTSKLDAITDGLHVYNFAFNAALPPAITIDGITVTINKKCSPSGHCQSVTAQLTYGGSLVGDDLCGFEGWSSTESDLTYGGSSNTWGRTWTREEVVDSSFGFVIGVWDWISLADWVASIDSIRIVINYTQASGKANGNLSTMGCG